MVLELFEINANSRIGFKYTKVAFDSLILDLYLLALNNFTLGFVAM